MGRVSQCSWCRVSGDVGVGPQEGMPGDEGRAGDRDLVLELSTHSIFIQDLQKPPFLV